MRMTNFLQQQGTTTPESGTAAAAAAQSLSADSAALTQAGADGLPVVLPRRGADHQDPQRGAGAIVGVARRACRRRGQRVLAEQAEQEAQRPAAQPCRREGGAGGRLS